MKEKIKILSLNVHKGFSHFNARYTLPHLRDAIRELSPDIVFLQEVLGENHLKTSSYSNATSQSQYEYLADSIWSDFAYGKNAIYPEGHHGNALLSKFPIHAIRHRDISTYRLEQRGLLHCDILHGPTQKKIHCICIHLGLLSFHRKRQFEWIVDYVKTQIPMDEPLILAGDLNDWSDRAASLLASPLQLEEAFVQTGGKVAKTFPSFFPLLSLDRIYLRGFKAQTAEVLRSKSWSEFSDHAGISADLNLL